MNKHIKVIKIVSHKDVKQTIIEFFATKTTEEAAIAYYTKAEMIGYDGGTESFDEAIDIICEGLELDSNDLEANIKALKNESEQAAQETNEHLEQ